jgi:hypothetical protein
MAAVPKGSGLLLLTYSGAPPGVVAKVWWPTGSQEVTTFPARIVMPLNQEAKIYATRTGYAHLDRAITLTELNPRWVIDLPMERIRPLFHCGLYDEEIAIESGFEATDSGDRPKSKVLFDVRGWMTIDERGDVHFDDGRRRGLVGHITARKLDEMKALRTAALASPFWVYPFSRCSDCGGAAYYACDPGDYRPDDGERCLLGADGVAGAKHRDSPKGKALLGWIFAVERDVYKAMTRKADAQP